MLPSKTQPCEGGGRSEGEERAYQERKQGEDGRAGRQAEWGVLVSAVLLYIVSLPVVL